MSLYACICHNMLHMQIQGNTWLFSPCDALFGRDIIPGHSSICVSRAGFCQGWGIWICVMYFWSFHFSWKNSAGWGAQQKKSCRSDHRSTTNDGGYYHHAVMVSTLLSKISRKAWTWRRYQGLGHPWKEVKCMHNLHILQIIAHCTYGNIHLHIMHILHV